MSNNTKLSNDETIKRYRELEHNFYILEGEIRSFIAWYIDNNFGALDMRFFTQIHEDFMYGFCKKTDHEFKNTHIYKFVNDDAHRRSKETNDVNLKTCDKA
jgi:hypothetical protein